MYVYVYIQVLWLGKERCDVTWEPAKNVPPLVIQEFEQGSVTVAMDSTSAAGICQTVHTLTFSQTMSTVPSPQLSASDASTSKRPVVTHNDG